jgi:hypothetical protein
MSRDCFGAVAEHLAEGFDRSDMRSPIRAPAGFKGEGHVGARAVGKITLRFTVADTRGLRLRGFV